MNDAPRESRREATWRRDAVTPHSGGGRGTPRGSGSSCGGRGGGGGGAQMSALLYGDEPGTAPVTPRSVTGGGGRGKVVWGGGAAGSGGGAAGSGGGFSGGGRRRGSGGGGGDGMSPGQMTSLLYGDAAVSPRPPRTAPASGSRRADAAIAATHLEGCVQPVQSYSYRYQARPVRPVVVRAKHPRPAGPSPKPRAGRLCTREKGHRSRQACAPAERVAAVAPRRRGPMPPRVATPTPPLPTQARRARATRGARPARGLR